MTDILEKTTTLLQDAVDIIDRQMIILKDASNSGLLDPLNVRSVNDYVKTLLSLQKEWKEEVSTGIDSFNKKDASGLADELEKALALTREKMSRDLSFKTIKANKRKK